MDKKVPLPLALCVLLGFILSVSIGQLVFAVNVNGLLLILLILLCGITCCLGYTFDSLLKIILDSVAASLASLFIFVLIGALVASWIFSGSLPTILYYGSGILSPTIILPTTFILCMVVSIVAGTSWGTISTIGIIAIQIASTMDITLAAVAGAAISGACFGDKLSPMSDTTNLAALSNGVNVFSHIRAMLLTTVPTAIIALIFYTWYGLSNHVSVSSTSEIIAIREVLDTFFKLDLIALSPLFVTLFLTFVWRTNALVPLGSGIFLSCLVGVYWQGNTWSTALDVIANGFSITTDNAFVNTLLNRGGIDSMMGILTMSLLVISIGGLLSQVGYLSLITSHVIKLKDKRTALTAAAIGTTGVCCMATGDSYMPIIITSKVFREVFDRSQIARCFLSRCCEDGATLLVPIIPWSVTAIFFSQTLGVPTIDYLPFAILCWLNPIISIIFSIFEGRLKGDFT